MALPIAQGVSIQPNRSIERNNEIVLPVAAQSTDTNGTPARLEIEGGWGYMGWVTNLDYENQIYAYLNVTICRFFPRDVKIAAGSIRFNTPPRMKHGTGQVVIYPFRPITRIEVSLELENITSVPPVTRIGFLIWGTVVFIR